MQNLYIKEDWGINHTEVARQKGYEWKPKPEKFSAK